MIPTHPHPHTVSVLWSAWLLYFCRGKKKKIAEIGSLESISLEMFLGYRLIRAHNPRAAKNGLRLQWTGSSSKVRSARNLYMGFVLMGKNTQICSAWDINETWSRKRKHLFLKTISKQWYYQDRQEPGQHRLAVGPFQTARPQSLVLAPTPLVLHNPHDMCTTPEPALKGLWGPIQKSQC